MKQLTAILLIAAGFFAMPVQAAPDGHTLCPAGRCWSNNQIIQFAEGKLSRKLNCDPNEGSCSAVEGREYEWHVTTVSGGLRLNHYRVFTTAANQPAIGHFLLFWNQSVSTFNSCNFHPNWRGNRR